MPKSPVDDELIRAQRLASIGELMAGLSHEARNILSGILSFSQVGKARTGDPERMAEIMSHIEEEALRCIDLFSAALSHSRLVANEPALQQPAAQQPLATLCEALESSTRLVRHQLAMRRIQFTCPAFADKVHIAMDAGALRQVILNLLINAMQATPSGGAIRVSIAVRSEDVVVAFDDSGPGVAPELREAIFERDYTTKSRGTGFGLAITKALVESASATIRVEDSELGGARFVLIISRPKEVAGG